MMDKECCRIIIQDTKNVINLHVVIQFKWKSPKPLQLIDIKGLLDYYAKQITTVSLKIHIDEDNTNSITVYGSKLTKYKMKPRFSIPIKVVESSKTIVYGFIHKIEKQYHLLSIIPKGIYDACCMFYDCLLQIPLEEASAFTILFAIFELQPALSIKGWTLLNQHQQCQHLKDENVDSLAKRQKLMIYLTENVYDFSDIILISKSTIKNNILFMLSKYESDHVVQDKAYAPNIEEIINWTGSDIILSLIHYLVNRSSDHVSQSQTTWQFVEYFRRYCRDMQYDGALFYND
eukprot:151064_1